MQALGAGGGGGDASSDVIVASLGYLDIKGQPFPLPSPADVVAAASVRSHLDIHIIRAVGSAAVAWSGIMITYTFSARFVVFSLDAAWDRQRGRQWRCRGWRRRRRR